MNESIIIFINLAVLSICFGYIYPKYCRNSIRKLVIHDFFATITCIVVSGCLYWGTGIGFTVLGLNWFWFSIVSYFVLEMSFMLIFGRSILNGLKDDYDSECK